jgi:hypothetical protein
MVNKRLWENRRMVNNENVAAAAAPAAPKKPAAKPAVKSAPKAAAKTVAAKPVAKPVAKKAAAKPAAKKPVAAPAAAAPEYNFTKRYKMLTGVDDSAFCDKVVAHLSNGYELFGAPSITFNGKDVIVGQAVVLKKLPKAAKKK